jgi:hypothetical protein
LIVGLANGGISGVPGVVRLVKLELLAERVWEGLHLKAELIVKGVHHPICWTCREVLNADGSITTLKRKQYV